MKNFLSLSALTLILSSSSIIGANSLDMQKTTTSSSNYELLTTTIWSPLPPNRSFLTTAGDALHHRAEWAYITINLGNMKQEQIKGIGSSLNDSYTEHKVPDWNFHGVDPYAGIHHGPNFRNYFFEDKINSGWNYDKAISGAYNNFYHWMSKGIADHWARGKIKFLWHYDNNSNLLIEIVGSLSVGATFSTVEGIASIKLGDLFTIYYTK
ncbi:MAG: hypothetical protein ACRC8P_02995 [Spiroplasma sp.]